MKCFEILDEAKAKVVGKTKREDQSKMGNISLKNTLKKGKKCAIILNKPENLDVKILRRRKREYGLRIFAGT